MSAETEESRLFNSVIRSVFSVPTADDTLSSVYCLTCSIASLKEDVVFDISSSILLTRDTASSMRSRTTSILPSKDSIIPGLIAAPVPVTSPMEEIADVILSDKSDNPSLVPVFTASCIEVIVSDESVIVAFSNDCDTESAILLLKSERVVLTPDIAELILSTTEAIPELSTCFASDVAPTSPILLPAHGKSGSCISNPLCLSATYLLTRSVVRRYSSCLEKGGRVFSHSVSMAAIACA